jgi:uncharacterized membrane protein
MTRRRLDDDGSVLPLILGYAVLALVLVLVCANATTLYLAQKQLDSVADAAALAGADGFTLTVDEDGAVARLSDEDVRAQVAEIVEAVGEDVVLASATAPDGVSARVTVTSAWHPPILSLFVTDGVPLSSTATSRTALI